MTRRHPKRRTSGSFFLHLPLDVLESEAFTELCNFSLRILIALASQYRGRNNGDLALTFTHAKKFGVTSNEQLVRGLRELQDHRLIVKTRQGGKKPLGPCLYALTWRPIDELNGKIESVPTVRPSDAWKTWRRSERQDCRRPASGLPAEHCDAKSGRPADQNPSHDRTAGSPPLRSRGGDAVADIGEAIVNTDAWRH